MEYANIIAVLFCYSQLRLLSVIPLTWQMKASPGAMIQIPITSPVAMVQRLEIPLVATRKTHYVYLALVVLAITMCFLLG